MTPEAIYLGAVLAAAIVLFYTGWIRPDVTALLVMLSTLVPWLSYDGRLTSLLAPEEAFSGFGSSAVVMVGSMFVLSAAMVRTGAANMLGDRVLALGRRSERSLQVVILLVITAFSAFINDTTTVLLWMPLVLALCRERGYPPERVLLLLAYASLLGGQGTLIGTRSNIVISDYLRLHAGEGLGFFSFLPVALAVWGVALLFVIAFGSRLLPKRDGESLSEHYRVQEFLTEVMATPGAGIVGRALGEVDLGGREEVQVLQIIRGQEHLPPLPWLRLSEDDVIVVQGRMSAITKLLAGKSWTLKEQLTIGDQTLRSVDLVMVEALVAPGSDLERRTLTEAAFPRQYGVSVLAVARQGEPLAGRPLQQQLRFGDSLLLVGHESEIDRLRMDPNLLVLEARPVPHVGRGKAWLTLGLLGAIVVVSATRLLPPSVVILAAAVIAVLARTIGAREAYRSLDMQALVVVGAMIGYGHALETTGTARLVAEAAASTMHGFGPHAMFAALLLLTVVLTQLIENAAVAIILAPVGYELAVAAQANPMPFLLGVAICTSSAFMTPVAHESTILVMAPGRYRFADYLRLGTPLALIVWGVTTLVLPIFYPLQ